MKPKPMFCKDCDSHIWESMFVWLADSLWEKIEMKPDEFLCANCTIKRLSTIVGYIYVVPSEGTHHIKAANATITMHQKHE